MELKEKWQMILNCFLLVVVLFTTSININLGKIIININSLYDVMTYNEQWIFIGDIEKYSKFVDKELDVLKKLKEKHEKTSKRNSV